ncbi:MAG: AraC family transcriptional regulator [Ruminococcaceae bacterium]|nr:AraC family transcriptional regulator [Oscillospiraceae bacterium]
MENIFYEYHRDKSTKMAIFYGKSNIADRHFHRNLEIIYVLEGEIEATVGDESFVAAADEIIFVHNYYVHSFKPKTEYNKYVIIIPAEYCDDVDEMLKASTIPSLCSDREFNRGDLKPIFDKMFSETDVMPPLVKKGYVNVIIGMLFGHYPSLSIKTPANIEIMVDVLQYINLHYKEPLTLDGVAGVFGYNKYYFSRIFNRYIGESMSNYINVVRIQNFMRQAKREENPQIAKLAEECGFESMPTFYRTFSKIYGESPKSYFSSRSR